MPSLPPDARWALRLDVNRVRQLVSGRALEVALASRLVYVEAPTLAEGAVRAALAHEANGTAGGETFRVELRMHDEEGALLGACSRCVTTFGPCVHMATVAVDLGGSAELREALVNGASTAVAAGRAPDLRAALDAERRFDGALRAWLAPAAAGVRVEIAASPFAEIEPHLGRAYGECVAPSGNALVSVFVRRFGERKLLSAREITALDLSPRDRRVLTYVRDRGSGKKAAHASGVEASLVVEAMRAHGGVFAAGWKGLLDFRAPRLRPSIALAPSGEDAPYDALAAVWTSDDGAVRIPFDEAVLLPGPFPFVWSRSGAIHRVAADVDLDVAATIARDPTLRVPRGRLKDAGARLLRATRGRGIAMPAAEAFGLPAIETPRIVVRLGGEPLDVRGEALALYRGREVPLFGDAASSEDGRDLTTEARARARIEEAGLVERDGDDDDDDDASGARIAVRGEAAIAFWQAGLLALRASEDPPIDVELARRIATVRVGSPVSARVHVVLEGNWLGTRLEFKSNELPVELAAIRTALSRKQRWVALSDGTLSRIEASIEALTREASDVMGDAPEALLPAHQLGRLDRWIEENDGRIDAAVEALRKRLRALAVAAEPIMPRGLEATLRPYQRLGLAWLQFLQALGAGGILADDMGLGKTITTLAFLLQRKESEGGAPSLVVCPTSVATNWVREAARFTPGLRVLLLHGPSGRARERARSQVAASDVVVTTYALLRRDLAHLAAMPFRCVILDEAQNVKNAESATRRAAMRLDASMRIALTGTPIENRLHELWSLASFANPGMLGTARAFETRFERPIAADRGSPLAAELRAVVRPFLLRRTKADVLRELPPKTEVDRFVTLTTDDKRMYDALAHALRASLARDLERQPGGQVSLGVFTALMRLRQMACDPRLVDPSLDASRSAKRETFLSLVRELVAEGRRALVFSQFVALLTLWRKDLDAERIPYEYLDGSTTKRDEVVARFQEGNAPLFLISLKAGGAGLNLAAADTVIHCDPWWNPAVEDQATDRAYRIGQDKPVTVVRLVARGTIEEKILSLKAKKRELTRAVIGDDARALEGITQDDIRALLGDDGDAPARTAAPADSGAPTDRLATATRVLDPEFHDVVLAVKRWMATSGRGIEALAAEVDLPLAYAIRVADGAPFPCSRAVGRRIRARLRDWGT